MAEPARKPRTSEPHEATAPRLRPREVRLARVETDDAHPSEAHRLQDRVKAAFAAPAGGKLEALLMKLIIVAATCLVLRTVIVDGAFGLLR